MAQKSENGADLQAALRAAADPAARETIEYLPYDLIDPDPDNFYSIEGLDKLADSIATVGLLDPIRVRHSQTDGGHYVVTSGHRRRAAIKLLIDSGEEGWRNAVPCIVDRGERTPEWHELRLIFANSTSRQLSSAEMSRQAQRVEELLVSLKEQGYEFPGRMQDHVAAAMNTSASKLKRLHAIRGNAEEYILNAYDTGRLNENTAYLLSQHPQKYQHMIWVEYARAGQPQDRLTGDIAATIRSAELLMENHKCPLSPGICSVWDSRFSEGLRRRFEGSKVGNCQKGGCCKGCPALLECEAYCFKCKAERQRKEAEQTQRRAELEDIFREAEASRTDGPAAISGGYRQTGLLFDRVQRIRRAAEASGADLRHVFSMRSLSDRDLETYLSIINGGPDPNHELDELFDDTDELVDLADDLECSTDFLLGRSDEPFRKEEAKEEKKEETKAVAAPEWQKGNPPISGWYLVWSTWLDFRHADYEMLFWSGDKWTEGDRGRASKSKVLAWFRVPQKTGAPTGEEASA